MRPASSSTWADGDNLPLDSPTPHSPEPPHVPRPRIRPHPPRRAAPGAGRRQGGRPRRPPRLPGGPGRGDGVGRGRVRHRRGDRDRLLPRAAQRAAGRLGLDLRGGPEAAAGDEVVPRVQDRHLVPARVARPPVVEVRAVPVRLERLLVLERRELLERDLEPVAPEQRGVPGDVHNTGCHQAPTSARIAPGPSPVRPRPSASAPTRMAILPRCSFLYIDWCASATPSNVIVFHSTGRILPDSISSFALVASYAFAKWLPMICFWRIHR